MSKERWLFVSAMGRSSGSFGENVWIYHSLNQHTFGSVGSMDLVTYIAVHHRESGEYVPKHSHRRPPTATSVSRAASCVWNGSRQMEVSQPHARSSDRARKRSFRKRRAKTSEYAAVAALSPKARECGDSHDDGEEHHSGAPSPPGKRPKMAAFSVPNVAVTAAAPLGTVGEEVSSFQRSDATAVVESSSLSATEKAVLRMQEEIALLEASIELLAARRATASQTLVQAQTEHSHWLKRVDKWQTRFEQLSDKQQKQVSLQRELDQSVAQSKARLERLTATDVTVEEIGQLSASQTAAVDHVHDLLHSGASAAPPTSDVLAPEGPEEDPTTTTTNWRASRSDVFPDRTDPVPAPLVPCAEEPESEKQDKAIILDQSAVPPENEWKGLSMPDVESFWDVKRDVRVAELNFFACITSAERLQSILDVTVRETLTLDSVDPSGRHRREAMWNTCLDARLMVNNNINNSNNLAPVQGSSVAAEATAEDAEEDTARHRVDPYISLCPFELAGACADPDCSYQHLGKRSMGAVLPRELVPLTKLRLDIDNRHSALQKKGFGNLSGAVVGGEVAVASNESEVGDTIDEENDGIVMNNDFIALPNANANELVDDVSCDESIDEGFDRLFANAGRVSVWWMDVESLARVRELPMTAHISAILNSFGVLTTYQKKLTYKNRKQILNIQTLDNSPTTVAGCVYGGKLLDCTRLAVHAGRFDVSSSLVDLAFRIYDNFGNPERHTIMHSFSRIFSSLCRILMKKSSFTAYAFGSDPTKSSFLVAFESQVQMAIGSFFFEQLHQFQIDFHADLTFATLNLWNNTALEITNDDGHELELDEMTSDQIAAAIKIECTIENDLSLPDQVHHMRVQGLLSSIQGVGQLRPLISQITSPRSLIDNILYPSFNEVRKMFQRALDNDEEPTEVVLKGIAIICYIIFGALESGANYFQTGAANNELRELHSVIDNILIQIRSLSSAIPIMDLLLSPVFAANVALAVSLKLYDTAHYRLESLLCKLTDEYANCQIRRLFAPYSELLWSQLIQLRASLPTRLVDSGATVESARVSLKLPKHIVDSHAALCNSISELGVYPHHVSLNNDWNLVEALRVSGILNMPKRVQKQSTLHCSCRALHRVLMRVNSECIRFSFGNTDLKIRGTCQDIKSAIPHSLILAGPSMIELDLSGTGLRRLPLHFGLYFPKLQRLVLSDNILDELPETMQHLEELSELYVGGNKLTHLPTSFVLPNLLLLFAQNNLLTELPYATKNCTALKRLNLAGNPVGQSFWTLAAQLPNLIELKPQC